MTTTKELAKKAADLRAVIDQYLPPPSARAPIAGLYPDADHIAAVLKGDTARFEVLIQKYLPRVFATARRYARREDEVEDIVQEVWLKAFQKLGSFRGEAPFEHWLMRLTVRTSGSAAAEQVASLT